MAVMRCRRVLVGCVALPADAVAGGAQLRPVRLVAVAAGHTRREHLALLERAVVVDLVAHLSVGVIQPARQPRDDVRVGQRPTGYPILGKLAAARMAQAAGLDLLAQHGGGDAALPVAGAGLDGPGAVVRLGEAT